MSSDPDAFHDNTDHIISNCKQHARHKSSIKGKRLADLIIFSHPPPQKRKKAIKENIFNHLDLCQE
jgi:hypothetical protein